MRPTNTPAGAIARGLVAGAAGTAAMTGAQLLYARLTSGGGDDRGGVEGDGRPRDPWEDAPAPAKVGRRILGGLFGVEVPPERIGLLTNVMHWAYGTGWGAVFGIARGSGALRGAAGGAAFGMLVWAASYAQLVPMGIYEPPWRYSASELASEGGFHLAYGLGAALGWSASGLVAER